MKNAILVILLIFILGCAKSPVQSSAASIDWINDLSVAKDEASAQGKPILIDFHAKWCIWCKRMDENTYADNSVAEKAKEFICVKIDTDEHPDIAKEYNINGLPTTLFLNQNGDMQEAIPGYLPPEKFLKMLDRILAAK